VVKYLHNLIKDTTECKENLLFFTKDTFFV
jgi:hypothetical protein